MQFNVSGQIITLVTNPTPETIVSGGVDFNTATFTVDSSWDDYTLTAVFKRIGGKGYAAILPTTGTKTCYIPSEVIKGPGAFVVGIFGTQGEDEDEEEEEEEVSYIRKTSQWTDPIDIISGTTLESVAIPTRSVYDEILVLLNERSMPSGGTSGQALVKSSSTDYDVTWSTITTPTKISDLIDDTTTNPIDKADTLTNLTATTTELNYVSGITSNIQTQLNNLNNNKQDTITSSTDLEVNTLTGGISYTTTAPTEANTGGLKFVVLSSEPATKYSGWMYIITEA